MRALQTASPHQLGSQAQQIAHACKAHCQALSVLSCCTVFGRLFGYKIRLAANDQCHCFSFNAQTVRRHNESCCAWCNLTSVIARCYDEKGLTTKSPQECMYHTDSMSTSKKVSQLTCDQYMHSWQCSPFTGTCDYCYYHHYLWLLLLLSWLLLLLLL